MIERIQLEQVLSFRSADIKLNSLNLIIGANGAGKSNLLRCIAILQHLPTGLRAAGNVIGGFNEFFSRLDGMPTSMMWLRTQFSEGSNGSAHLKHLIVLEARGLTCVVDAETLELLSIPTPGKNLPRPLFDVHKGGGAFSQIVTEVLGRDSDGKSVTETHIDSVSIGRTYDFENSLFQQLRGPQLPDETTNLARRLSEIAIYGRWDTTPHGPIRPPQSTSLDGTHLLPDGSNLSLVYNQLEVGPAGVEIERWLKKFNPRLEKVRSVVFGGQIQLYFTETNVKGPIAATAVSDGTLQFLLLLCVLLHPSPPPLICLEEPEISLHPDAIPMLARLLQVASERTQIIVTTHSERLIDCFSHAPENVLVAEREPVTGETVLKRLEAPALKEWMKEFSMGLGQMWTSGEIGGGIRE